MLIVRQLQIMLRYSYKAFDVYNNVSHYSLWHKNNQIGSFLLNTQIILSEGVDHIWCSIVLILTFFFYNPKMKSVQKVLEIFHDEFCSRKYSNTATMQKH